MSIEELISEPEGKTIEFKRDLSSPKNILKTMVAFANSSGGCILAGIEDKTKAILGIESPLSEEERLTSLVSDNISPKLLPNIEIVNWKNRHLIKIEVYPSSVLPHFLRKEGEDSGVYVRLGSSNRKADSSMVAELKRIADQRSFDDILRPELSFNDIDFDSAKSVFEDKTGNVLRKRDLKSLKNTGCYQKKLVPTNGGILLWGNNRSTIFPDIYIQCARFQGTEKITLIDQLDIYEHLPIASVQAIDFVKKHSMLEGKIEYIHRKDRWNMPMEAIREGIINAVVHADYSLRGLSIKIAFFDDRIEIINPGLFINGITKKDIQEGTSKVRNRVIARTFKELGLVEEWGTGFRKIQKSCQEYGLPKPDIDEVGGPCVRLTLYTKSIKEFLNITKKDHELLLKLSKSGKISVSDLAKKLKTTPRTVRMRMSSLTKRELVITIAKNVNDPNKKYVISPKGESVL